MNRLAASVTLASIVALGCGRPKAIVTPDDAWQRHLSKNDEAHAKRHSTQAPVPDPAQTSAVSLHGILAYADRHAPAIAVALSGFANARADQIAASLRLPSDPTLGTWFGPRIGPGGTAIDFGLSLQQQFELGGQRGLRMKAAKLSRKLAKASVSDVKRLVHLRVHSAFHAALLARERIVAAAKLLAFSERLLTVARKRLKAGDIAAFHVQVAEGELALAKQQKMLADAAYVNARLTLAEVSGWPSKSPPSPKGILDKPRTAPPVATLLKIAMTSHPALRTRASRIELAAANVRVADRGRIPNITVGLSYGQEAETSTTGTTRQHIALLNLSIPLPLFRKNRAERARVQARLISARTDYTALRRMVGVRVRRAVAAVNSAAGQLDAYGTEIMPTFEKNLKKLGRAFELGEIDVLQVLVARGRFLQLQREALNAYAAYFSASARLEAEVGDEIWHDESHNDTKTGGAK